MTARWYVVHVYSGFEKKVAAAIKEQAEKTHLDDLLHDVLVPIEEVVELRRGSKVKSERKFFPGYVLVNMELTDETWHLVKDTPKVTGFLGAKGRPTPISAAEAERITRQVQEGVDRLRDRRTGPCLRRPLYLVQRPGRGRRRGKSAAQGVGLDLRSADPGRPRIFAGREDVTFFDSGRRAGQRVGGPPWPDHAPTQPRE
jgi:transcription antitermination factor NusG